ncbi:ankyrin repeat domain-containing protein 34C [Pseudorasbora parva]|uniref:ankyrin repeat domain-containing protein 34C n=1 Tax=Pseudorasbora parva TaxID=51549 RepID=UPI00351E2225
MDPAGLLLDGGPLIGAARLGKLRLVRLLVEGGAQVNQRSSRGETALLAACRALRADPTAPDMLRLIRFLLSHRAEPNLQDRTGRTALMYACMERAGAAVAAELIAAGADASMEDYSGASALVYAINAQDPDTLAVLLESCRARGRQIIIIATDLSRDGSRYRSAPPSPVSCMSPSDIELKTNSPGSDGENIFSFRADGSPRLRSDSEPRQNPTQSYEMSLTENSPDITLQAAGMSRRNTLPDLLPPPSLRLTLSGSASRLPSRTSSMFLAPPDGLPSWKRSGEQSGSPARRGFLPPLPGGSGGRVLPLRSAPSEGNLP